MRLSMVIAAVDFSPESERAAGLAASVAVSRGARLALIHVEPPPILATIAAEPMFVPPQWLESLRERHDHEIAGKLAWLTDRLREAAPGLQIEDHIRLDEPADGIAGAARDLGADLVVTATRGAGATRFLLGSVAAKVAQRAPCPVLVADRGQAPVAQARFRRVLCGIDYSPFSRPLAELAAASVEPDGVIELAHVWHEPRMAWLRSHPEREEMASKGVEHARRRLAHLLGDLGLPHPAIELWIGSGSPASELLDRAEATGTDLIVIGAHGRRGVSRALGTVADRLLRHATCAVLILPAPALAGSMSERSSDEEGDLR